MPDCDYCDRSFEDEDAYLDHLGAEHDGELGRIDRRRVASHTDASGFDVPPIAYYAVGGVALFLLSSALVYFLAGSFFADPIHEHGTIELTIDGESHEFSGTQYTSPDDFHFHGSGPVWHMHPPDNERMTLAEAMDAIDIELTADAITVDGETYDAAESGTELTIRVNGEEIDDPGSYELHGVGGGQAAVQGEGDDVEIVVESGQE